MRTIIALLMALLLSSPRVWAAPTGGITVVIPIKFARVSVLLPLCRALYPALRYEARAHALAVSGQQKDIQAVEAFIDTVDIRMRLFAVDFEVVSLSDEGFNRLGLMLSSTVSHCPGQLTMQESDGSLSWGTRLFATGFVTSRPLKELFNDEGSARVVATRHVVVQDLHACSVVLGGRVPVAYFDSRAGHFQVEFIDLGLHLSVEPVQIADGCITLHVARDVATVRSLDGAGTPEIRTLHGVSDARLRDGDTAILCGMPRDRVARTLGVSRFLTHVPPPVQNDRQITESEISGRRVLVTATVRLIP